MRNFFISFVKKYRRKLVLFSLFRLVPFAQSLFWPFAFAKVIDILNEDIGHWQLALWWVGIMIANKILEDLFRLRSKFGLEKLGTHLKISLAEFFSEQTEVCENCQTGEAVQAVRRASDVIQGVVDFYKENALQLPINLLVIPFVLYQADSDYLLLLVLYALFYVVFDYLIAKIYQERMVGLFRSSEAFWGTTYRKAPEVWRGREDSYAFAACIDGQGDLLYRSTVAANNINNWRWVILQGFSSAALGASVLFVLFKLAAGEAHVGDLILVSSYFQKTQGTLNIATSALTHFIHTRIALSRLARAVRLR